MVEISGFWVCLLSLLFSLSIIFALCAWWYPEIKRLVSPKERRIRRGKAKLERAQEAYDCSIRKEKHF